jgi:polysaccharide chain length determinant protein (PEP-CTERM system associated)
MNVEEGFQLKDLWPMIQRRMALSGAVAGVTLLGAIALAAWLPNRYGASATILVEPQAISERLIESGLEQSDLNKRLNIMTAQILSRPRLSRIIDDMKLFAEESEDLTREEIIELMREQILVVPVLPELAVEGPKYREIEINTFRITFFSDSPQTAAAVANRLANDFIEQHIRERVQLSGDTSEFIQAELERLTTRIREVEAQIAQVKEQNAGSLPEDMLTTQGQLTRLLDRRQTLRNELALARSDAAFFQQQAAVAFDQPHFGDEAMNPARRLDSLEIALGSFRAKGYTDKHPDVISTLQEMEEVKKLIDTEQDEEKEGPNNVAQQNAAAQQSRAELQVQSAEEELALLAAREEDLTDRLARTPRVAEQLAALQREWDYLSKKFHEFSDKRLQAGVAADVERRQKGEQFRVLESAVAPLEPTSPNRVLIVAMGIVLGLALGGMSGLLAESADTSFHGARQLQGALRIPVLAAIPSIMLESDRLAARQRAFRRGVVTAGVVGLVLGSSAFGYWWTNMTGTSTAAAPQTAPAPAPVPSPAGPQGG